MCFRNSFRVLPTSRVVYQPTNRHMKVRFIALLGNNLYSTRAVIGQINEVYCAGKSQLENETRSLAFSTGPTLQLFSCSLNISCDK